MKVNCEYCGKSINKLVMQNITKNEVGRIQCPHCHKENKRYISEFDLLYCFLLNAIVYGLTIILFHFVTTSDLGISNHFFYSLFLYDSCCLRDLLLFHKKDQSYTICTTRIKERMEEPKN
jgi:hypothetical protein